MPELNLDGLVGPSHNYAGLSLGNLAATSNAGAISAPRAAALQGLGRMRLMLSLGIPQGILLPHRRPNTRFLRSLGFRGSSAQMIANAAAADPALLAAAVSASAMWTANAATVSPAADTQDGCTHFTVANLVSMPHRSHEWPETLAQLRLVFADRHHFAVHPPITLSFGDEGAANHMRFAPQHTAPGDEIFVFGVNQRGQYPARQHKQASEAIARGHGVRRAHFVQQSDRAIEAGAFHNDVVAVSNETLLFAHEAAFEHRAQTLAGFESRISGFKLVEASEAEVPLADAISSYVFNAALVSVEGGMALVLPKEAQETPSVWQWLNRVVADHSNPIHALHVLDLQESMRNGGGPACLRLRVPLSPSALACVDGRFLMNEHKITVLERLIESHWPERINPSDLTNPDLWEQCDAALNALLQTLDIGTDELWLE